MGGTLGEDTSRFRLKGLTNYHPMRKDEGPPGEQAPGDIGREHTMANYQHNDCAAHTAIGWAHHRIAELLAATPVAADAKLGVARSVAFLIEQGRAQADAARHHVTDGSGRNQFAFAAGSPARAAYQTATAVERLNYLIARRRAVRRGRYADAQPGIHQLPGVAYASNGDQVLTDSAITWAAIWSADQMIARGGHCHGPVVAVGEGGTMHYQPHPSTAAKRTRRKTPETAAKEIARAIEQVAAGKRAEGYARDRIHKYAELFDVDTYDAQCDALDLVLESGPHPAEETVTLVGGSLQASLSLR